MMTEKVNSGDAPIVQGFQITKVTSNGDMAFQLGTAAFVSPDIGTLFPTKRAAEIYAGEFGLLKHRDVSITKYAF